MSSGRRAFETRTLGIRELGNRTLEGEISKYIGQNLMSNDQRRTDVNTM